MTGIRLVLNNGQEVEATLEAWVLAILEQLEADALAQVCERVQQPRMHAPAGVRISELPPNVHFMKSKIIDL